MSNRRFQDSLEAINNKSNVLDFIEESLIHRNANEMLPYSDDALCGLALIVGEFSRDVKKLHNQYSKESHGTTHETTFDDVATASQATQ
ncbi:MAG: hypothetical protein ACNI3A_01495 [Desulfovibrio sp.]|uniref:hypothetical protein n=1 Tax=Desulfovibrio sp. 7SRBS1 TaxID=3378064 RepID=UPI003B415330